MVVQNQKKQEKDDKTSPSSDFQYVGKVEPDSTISDKEIISPYEKKYYALLSRCKTIFQSNQRLVNRIVYVKKFTKRCDKQRKFIMNRLNLYNDDYRNARLSVFAESHKSEAQWKSFQTSLQTVLQSLNSVEESLYGASSSPVHPSTEPTLSQPSTSIQPPTEPTIQHGVDTKVETITL